MAKREANVVVTTKTRKRGKRGSPTQQEDVVLYPGECCHKCGKKHWRQDLMRWTWSCLYCGNISYYTLGTLYQQIDIVMNNEARSDQYVYSNGGRSIVPKIDDTIRKIRFRERQARDEWYRLHPRAVPTT